MPELILHNYNIGYSKGYDIGFDPGFKYAETGKPEQIKGVEGEGDYSFFEGLRDGLSDGYDAGFYSFKFPSIPVPEYAAEYVLWSGEYWTFRKEMKCQT